MILNTLLYCPFCCSQLLQSLIIYRIRRLNHHSRRPKMETSSNSIELCRKITTLSPKIFILRHKYIRTRDIELTIQEHSFMPPRIHFTTSAIGYIFSRDRERAKHRDLPTRFRGGSALSSEKSCRKLCAISPSKQAGIGICSELPTTILEPMRFCGGAVVKEDDAENLIRYWLRVPRTSHRFRVGWEEAQKRTWGQESKKGKR